MTTRIPDELEDAESESDCGRPCDPAARCPHCANYWQRMRDEGYWVDGRGWTDKGMKEMCK